MGRFHWRHRRGNPGDRSDVTAFVLWCLEAVREGGQRLVGLACVWDNRGHRGFEQKKDDHGIIS